MGFCCVVGCSNRTDRSRGSKIQLRFFSFPKVISNQCVKTLDISRRRRALRIARINRKDLRDADIKTHSKVCSSHFVSGAPSVLFDETNPDWSPSQSLGYSSSNSERAKRGLESYSRAKARAIYRSVKKQQQSDAENEPVEGHLEESENSASNHQEFDDADTEQQELMVDNESLNEHSLLDQSYSNAVGAEAVLETRTEANSPGASDSLQKQYSDICKKAKNLRDQVTNLEVDKLELEASVKSSDMTIKNLKRKLGEMEEVIKKQEEVIQLEAKLRKEYEDKLKANEKELELLRQRVMEAEKILFTDLEAFAADEEKVKFYTGLPSFDVFKVLVDGRCSFFEEQSVETIRFALKPWQCVLLTLMRLRLSLTLQDLAYRFGIHVSTACRVFVRFIDAMYNSIYPLLVKWPDRETLWETMPREFRESYGNSVAVIIDCFEIFTEKPSSLENRAMIWSNYKHHHTVKTLIGISPTGAITFVSTAWGARASDKHVVQESGLYEFLLPCDVVMADRGFNIAECLALYGAKLLIPAFTRGQDQLSSHDIALTRKIANLRIHVERVIGLVRRKFRILKSILPVEMLTVREGEQFAPIDKIVRVCCALVNMCPSIVVHPDIHDATE